MVKMTAFKNLYQNQGQNVESTWEHIVARLSVPKGIEKKEDAPLISPVEYATNLDGFTMTKESTNAKGKKFQEWTNQTGKIRVTDENGVITRSNKNVVAVSMLIFDYDSGKAVPEAIIEPWKEYNHIIHSTFSHTPDNGKYRLIVPFKEPISKADFKSVWGDVSKIAGDIDVACKDPARMFYWPSYNRANGKDSFLFQAKVDGKLYQPKIKKVAAKKIKRGDYKTLDVVKFFFKHSAYYGPANKAGQHWVKCPWEDEHEHNTDKVDAVIYETTGENWPTFSCSHNTCRQNERNIIQVIRVWGDADDFCTRAITKDAIKTDTKVKCLGRDDNGYYYYQSGKTNHVVRLRPEHHKELYFYDISPDIDYWFKNWGKEDNGRVDWKAAARDLMMRCHNAGYFKPTSVRGAGFWGDEKRVVVHLGDKLRVNDETILLTEFNSDFIYEAAVQAIRWEDPLSLDGVYKMWDIMNNLPIPDKIERFLFSGHLVSSVIAGCLRWRPHVWVTGSPGSGKTTIMNDVLNKLWAPIGGLFMEGRTTEAGVRQKIKHNSVPIIIDEVESNSKEESLRVESLIAMARSSSSNSEGNIAKGTISGSGLEFLVKSCFTFSSIAEALQWGQDKERFLIVNVVLNDHAKVVWPTLRKVIEDTIDKTYSLRFFSRCAKMSHIIKENCDIFHAAILQNYEKANSRNADQISVHAACAWSLRSDKLLSVEDAITILKQFGNESDWNKYWASDETNSAMSSLDKVLTKHLRGDTARQYTVAETLWHLKEPHLLGETLETHTENLVLQRYGMIVKDNYLWISKTNSELHTLLKDDGGIVSILSCLRGIDGICQKMQIFMGIQNPAIGIPLSVIYRKRT